MSTVIDISDLKADWIERDPETFVHRSENRRSGWEKKYKGEYSRYLLKNMKPGVDFLKLAHQLCSTRVRSLSRGRKVNLAFHPTESLTNGQVVLVSTQVADETHMSHAQKLDVMLGLTTHEMAHVLHSDFLQKYVSDFHDTLNNVIEDERIEYLMGEEFPGYSTQIYTAKSYYFDTLYKAKAFADAAGELFDCLFKFIRYPKYLDDTLIIKHVDFLRKAKAILTPYPMTTEATLAASLNLHTLFVDELGAIPKKGKRNIGKVLQAIAEAMKDLRSPSQMPEALQPSTEFEKDPLAREIVAGNVDFNSETKTYFIKAQADAATYQEIKRFTVKNSQRLAQILAINQGQKTITLRGMPNGVLDESYLVDAIHGHQNVHLQTTVLEAPTANLVFLVDESGSMHGSSIKAAQKIAVTVNEALSLLPGSEVFMYGFTSDHDGEGTNTITIYREPHFTVPFTLGTMSAKSYNRDGVCIDEVARRVRSFSKKPFLFVIISDGMPAADKYDNDAAVLHTRKMVEKVTANKFIPIQIGVDVEAKQQARMFKEYVTYADSTSMLKDLATKLPPLLRRLQ